MTHLARSPKTERWLDDLGVAWTFEPDLPLHRIDQAASLANQVRHQPLDEEVVERYANDMRQGDVFPAAIVAPGAEGMFFILGGNHRDAGHRRANHATQPAYIVEGEAVALLRIRVEDNRNHGLPTTKAERLDHGVALVAQGVVQRDAARIVGLPQPELTIHAGALNLAKRLDPPLAARAGKMPKSKRYELSRIVDDAALGPAVSLVLDAGLPIDHVRSITDQVNAVDDLTEALRLIGQLREDHHDRIVEQAGNIRAASRTARARLAEALAVIASLDPADIDATCPNDDVRARLAQQIMKGAEVLMPTHERLMATVKQAAA